MKLMQKIRTLTPRKLAWTTLGLCIGCCAIPVIALALGFSALAGLGIYFDRAALAVFIAGSLLFVYTVAKRSKPACSTTCSCKPAAGKQG